MMDDINKVVRQAKIEQSMISEKIKDELAYVSKSIFKEYVDSNRTDLAKMLLQNEDRKVEGYNNSKIWLAYNLKI